MSKSPTKSKTGFTIIEVVLVLAIAGLIFLMVFVAFPALQRSQHDTQRTDDMGRVQSSLIYWQNNHNNKLPGPDTKTGGTYVAFDADFQAPGGVFQENCDNQACQFVRDYMNSAATTNSEGLVTNTFEDPDGDYYNVVITKSISGETDGELGTITFNPQDNENAKMSLVYEAGRGYTLSGNRDAYAMFIMPGATCDGDHAVKSTKNNFAILYHMEGSGVKCTNNGS